MDRYRSSLTGQLERERQVSESLKRSILQQEKELDILKDMEQEKQQLEKKWEELCRKHSELEQKEKDLKLKVALDGYEQLCYNIGSEGRSSIRQLLVNLCQAEFEKNFEVHLMLNARSKKIDLADKEVRNELESLFEKQYQAAQTRALGNIWMTGELYNYGILSDNMILYFISRLLDEVSEESWPWLCELILTIQTSLVKNDLAVGKYFMKIKEILKSKTHLSHSSESLVQQIILEWEANADPDKIASLAQEKLPDSEPVTYKPVLYTVQSYEKYADHKPFKDSNKNGRGKSRGRYRGDRVYGNGQFVQNRGHIFSVRATDSFDDWYEQNMVNTYGLPKNPSFYSSYTPHNMRQGRPDVGMWGEQKMKKKSRHQQMQAQSSSKKEMLEGELKIGFHKPVNKKQEAPSVGVSSSAVDQKERLAGLPTPEVTKTATGTEKQEQTPSISPQNKLLNALGADMKVDDQPKCSSVETSRKVARPTPVQSHSTSVENNLPTDQQAPTVNLNTTCKSEQLPTPAIAIYPEASEERPQAETSAEISSRNNEQDEDDDADVLILSETVTEEKLEVVGSVLCSVKEMSLLSENPVHLQIVDTNEKPFVEQKEQNIESTKFSNLNINQNKSIANDKIGQATEENMEGQANAFECSSSTSEYSSPMESPVPSESKEKSGEIWTRLALLPHPGTLTPSLSRGEEAED